MEGCFIQFHKRCITLHIQQVGPGDGDPNTGLLFVSPFASLCPVRPETKQRPGPGQTEHEQSGETVEVVERRLKLGADADEVLDDLRASAAPMGMDHFESVLSERGLNFIEGLSRDAALEVIVPLPVEVAKECQVDDRHDGGSLAAPLAGWGHLRTGAGSGPTGTAG